MTTHDFHAQDDIRHASLVDIAKRSISNVFGDSRVPHDVAVASLNELKAHVEGLIEAANAKPATE